MGAPDDPHDLARFVAAQAGSYGTALAELRAGEKESHWMWFVFPQMRGLGFSPKASFFGIVSLAEARAYLAHPILGPRLLEATRAVLSNPGRPLAAIFGPVDAAKFRSSMTLFARAAGDAEPAFREALQVFCGGEPDPRTVEMLGRI